MMPRAVATALVAALALGACAGDGDGPDATPGTGAAGSTSLATSTTAAATSSTTVPSSTTVATTTTRSPGATTTTRPPVRGGTLVVGTASPLTSLDPAVIDGDGAGGGIELGAIYDVLVRYDPETGAYVPRLAASVVPDAEALVWTITLRAGVRFSDGSPFDAAAVKAGIERHRAPGSSAAASMASVRDVRVVDERTLAVTLRTSWPDFPWLLSTEVGMIPSPAAGPPVGAGPFVVDSFTPGGVLVVRRNDAWWGASPPLDAIRFTPTADRGGPRAVDALVTGGADAAYLVDPTAVRTAADKRLPGRAVIQHAGSTELLNLGSASTSTTAPAPATRFLRVRLAIVAAIDPGVVAERVTGARHEGDGDLVGRDTELWPRGDERRYDPDLARRLVAEARANGWDGKVRYLCDSSAAGQARGIAIETMLKAAGIDPVIDTTRDRASVRQALATGAFDMACSGFANTADAATGAADGSTLASLTAALASAGPANRTGWADGRVDTALVAWRAARTANERRAAVRTILDEVKKDAPFVVTGARTEQLAWSGRVHGIVASSGARVLVDAAFVTSGA